jgi:hypothetical protein
VRLAAETDESVKEGIQLALNHGNCAGTNNSEFGAWLDAGTALRFALGGVTVIRAAPILGNVQLTYVLGKRHAKPQLTLRSWKRQLRGHEGTQKAQNGQGSSNARHGFCNLVSGEAGNPASFDNRQFC